MARKLTISDYIRKPKKKRPGVHAKTKHSCHIGQRIQTCKNTNANNMHKLQNKYKNKNIQLS